MLPRLLAAACLALLTASCSASQQAGAADDAVVYLIERGWHTDIGLPVTDITGRLATLEKPYPGVSMLVFGFGERQFLVDRKKSFGAMLKALLPSRSAVLLTALKAGPAAAFGPHNVVALHVSPAGLAAIEDGIWREFELSGSGDPVRLAEGPYPGSDFYAAVDTYYGLFTCNTWTAETLHAGGLPIPVTGVLFSGQVMGPARWIGARQASSR